MSGVINMTIGDYYVNDDGHDLIGMIEHRLPEKIKKIFENKGYKYERAGKSNIIVIRNTNTLSGKYDDLEILFRDRGNSADMDFYSVTSDPSDYYLLNGLSKGTAIVKPQQASEMFKLGYHKGQYKALVQARKCWVIRDFNKDNILNFKIPKYTYREDIPTSTGTMYNYYDGNMRLVHREEYGLFGINNHRSHPSVVVTRVDKYSAGCIVHQDPDGYKSFINKIESEVSRYKEEYYNMTCILASDISSRLLE